MPGRLTNLSVTTIARLKPKPGLKQEALAWFRVISEKASQFDGHLGAEIFEAVNGSVEPEFAIIIHFDTYENLLRWEASAERKEQMGLSHALMDEAKPKIQLTGLEY